MSGDGRGCDDREALEIALIENIQREELNALEEAAAYRSDRRLFFHPENRPNRGQVPSACGQCSAIVGPAGQVKTS